MRNNRRGFLAGLGAASLAGKAIALSPSDRVMNLVHASPEDQAGSSSGYLYVSRLDHGPAAGAETGRVVRIPDRGPPWLIVDHELAGILPVGPWPGRLWRAEVVEAATAADQAEAGGPPRSDAGYTRAIAVRIGEELPAWTLFGPDGQAVAALIAAAQALTRPQAAALAAARQPEARAAVDRVWRRWLAAVGAPEADRDERFDSVLDIGRLRERSPVGSALAMLYGAVFDRAEALEGEAATVKGDDDDVWLAEPWRGASSALNDAALARGAPRFADDKDAAILLAAWRALFGD